MAKGLALPALLLACAVLVVGHDQKYKALLLVYCAAVTIATIYKTKYREIDSLTRLVALGVFLIISLNNAKIIQQELEPYLDILTLCLSLPS